MGRVLFMAKENRKEAPKEEEEMYAIQFLNEINRVIKELKIEKENVKFLEAKLKIEKEHIKSLKEKN